jgi:pimeloyl-ACP methyl ester carboxylesterase
LLLNEEMYKKSFCLLILSLYTMTTISQPFPSIADKFIEMDGLQIAYKDEGEGQIILCLHAMSSSSKDFTVLFDSLAKNYRVIAIDFPGHGNSASYADVVASRNYKKIIAQFIWQLNLKNIVIVGNSIGGAVAIRLANNNPNIKALVLSNPGGLDKKGFPSGLVLKYMANFFRKGERGEVSFQKKFERYYKKVLPNDTALLRREEITKDAYKHSTLLVQAWTSFNEPEEDLRPMIKNITSPVLFAWAMKDKYVAYGRNKKAISQFPYATVIKYEKAGHTPYTETPQLFIKDLSNYLKKL